jgi:hypothetical protein
MTVEVVVDMVVTVEAFEEATVAHLEILCVLSIGTVRN